MDTTHLRWFTRQTLADLLCQSGYRVQHLSGIYTLPQQDTLHLHGLARRLQRRGIAPGLLQLSDCHTGSQFVSLKHLPGASGICISH